MSREDSAIELRRFPRLAGGGGRVRRDLCRIRLRLYVQRVPRTVAARFRRLARFGIAGVLGRGFSLFRPRRRQRSPRRPFRFPASCGHRHAGDRPRACRRKRGAQPDRGLRGLWPRCRTWRRLRLCPSRWRGAAMVRAAARPCLRIGGKRDRRRYARDAAAGNTADRHAGMARRLSDTRRVCRCYRRRNGAAARKRSACAGPWSRRRSAPAGCGIAAGRLGRRSDPLAALHRIIRRLPDLLVRRLRAVRASRALRAEITGSRRHQLSCCSA